MVRQATNPKIYTIKYWKPMQGFESLSYERKTRRISNDTSKLYFLLTFVSDE